MFDMKCELCGSNISIDQQRTTNSYMATMDYIVDKDGELDMSTVQEYLYYKCHSCNKIYKYTIKDVEREVRRYFAETVMCLRRNSVSKDNKDDVNEDSVMNYCGKCRGQDGKGNCFSAIMNNCSIRNQSGL